MKNIRQSFITFFTLASLGACYSNTDIIEDHWETNLKIGQITLFEPINDLKSDTSDGKTLGQLMPQLFASPACEKNSIPMPNKASLSTHVKHLHPQKNHEQFQSILDDAMELVPDNFSSGENIYSCRGMNLASPKAHKRMEIMTQGSRDKVLEQSNVIGNQDIITRLANEDTISVEYKVLYEDNIYRIIYVASVSHKDNVLENMDEMAREMQNKYQSDTAGEVTMKEIVDFRNGTSFTPKRWRFEFSELPAIQCRIHSQKENIVQRKCETLNLRDTVLLYSNKYINMYDSVFAKVDALFTKKGIKI